jgi:hypothetical protein
MSKTRCIICIALFLFLVLPWTSVQPTLKRATITGNLSDSSEEIYTTIDSIFTAKNEDYATYGFYPQLYGPSLQATYYGLYILDVIGKLEQVNETQILDYLMSTYHPESHIFMDDYSYRYLETDFSKAFMYPLTSLLQVHCYGVLSLKLFNRLDLIDVDASQEFIWSCYNTFTSGFIGQPSSPSLEYYAKISTMDNTYYAVKTLDVLMGNWAEYAPERNEIISYINSLQVSNSSNWDLGGIAGDNESFFFPLRLFADANMFSSYYGIKTLELFGMEGTINYDTFYLFLEELYNPVDSSFQYMEGSEQTYANIAASALALELAMITGFTSYNESGTINFIFNGRNSLGIWDGSTDIQYHELLDTFQVIRVLHEMGLISQLTFEDTARITDTLLDYFLTPTSFSLLSKDYTTIKLLHTIISSYNLYDMLPELDFQDLYQKIRGAYSDYQPAHGFCSIVDPEYYSDHATIAPFRSYPIELFSRGTKHHPDDNEYFISHKNTYYALDSLLTMYKLDDFSLTCNLNRLVNDILATQFLNSSYPEVYGAFSYILPFEVFYPTLLINDIFFEYTYFAIKTLELLAEHLNIGDITFLDFNISALQSYIDNHLVETPEWLYFNPHSSDTIETILQNTYYMVYVLKALDIFDLDTEKIGAFVSHNINYSNIKNIYYSFMVSTLLNYDIEFDRCLVHTLMEEIFYKPSHEFFLTDDKNELDQEIFLWICEMIKGDSLRIEAWYPQESVLGGEITITASLYNMVLIYFENNLTFTLESDQLGTHIFDHTNPHNYTLTLLISHSSDNYPTIHAKIVSYTSSIKLAELSIAISTYYPEGEFDDVLHGTLVLSVLFVTVPGGIIIFSEKKLRKAKPNL